MEAVVAYGGRYMTVDRDARLRRMVEEHYAFIWRSVRRLGVPSDGADDVTQETFMVAAQKVERIEPGRERSFLFGIALRLVANARRAYARQPLSDETPDPASQALGPEELVSQKHARQLLDTVISALPLDVRAVFIMFELEGMPMVEIASCLGIPAGTVASRLRRGRAKFQEHVRRMEARASMERQP